jgi:hypothetical protein
VSGEIAAVSLTLPPELVKAIARAARHGAAKPLGALQVTEAPKMDALAQELAERLSERVARRVAELLGNEPERLIDAAEAGRRLGYSPEWVRDHADELGVIRGPGQRPRLRFNPALIAAYASSRGRRTVTPKPSTGNASQKGRERRSLVNRGEAPRP